MLVIIKNKNYKKTSFTLPTLTVPYASTPNYTCSAAACHTYSIWFHVLKDLPTEQCAVHLDYIFSARWVMELKV